MKVFCRPACRPLALYYVKIIISNNHDDGGEVSFLLLFSLLISLILLITLRVKQKKNGVN